MRGRDADQAGFGLAGLHAFVRRLQPVIGAIADHVRQRIAHEVDQLTVEFGLGAFDDQFDLLAQIDGEFAGQSGQRVEDAAHRLHAGAHHRVLQIGGDGGQALQRALDGFVRVGARHFGELVAGQNQFGHEQHQGFERIDGDADRIGAHRARRFALMLGRDAGDHGRGFGWRVGGRGLGRLRPSGNGRRLRRRLHARREGLEGGDERVVVARRLLAGLFDGGEDFLDAVDGRKHEGDGFGARRRAVAQSTDQAFCGVRYAREPHEAQKAARPLDRMNQPENAGNHLPVGRIAFEPHELFARRLDVLGRLDQEIFENVVHAQPVRRSRAAAGIMRFSG